MLRGQLTRHTAALAVGALLLGACSGSSSATDEPTGPEIGFEISESPTDSADPWAAPDPLTEEYILRVLTEIQRLDAEFTRWLRTSSPGEEPPPEVRSAVEAIYWGDLGAQVLDMTVEAYRENPGLRDFLVEPVDQYRVAAVEIHRHEPSCPLLTVKWDASGVERPGAPNPRVGTVIALRAAPAVAPNVTGWVFLTFVDEVEVSDEHIAEELASRELCE